MTIDNQIIVDVYSEKNLPLLKAFFNDVWSPKSFKRSSRWLHWHLVENPNAKDYPRLLVAKSKKGIVGILFLIPTPIWINGRSYVVSWGRDLYVDPNYRRHRIGLALNDKWVDLFGAAMGSGQSSTMRVLQKKHGWADISRIKQYEKLLYDKYILMETLKEGSIKFLKRGFAMLYAKYKTRNLPMTTNYIVTHKDQFSPDVDMLWDECKGEYSGICARDYSTLNWRFCNHPYYSYLVSEIRSLDGKYRGYIVTRQEATTCWIVDLLTYKDDQEIRSILVKSIENKYQQNMVFRFVSRNISKPVDATLKSMGYLTTHFCQFACVKTKNKDFHENKNDWYITSLDSDLDR